MLKYKKRLLIRCIHHFKSDLINNMDHMFISGTEPEIRLSQGDIETSTKMNTPFLIGLN